MIRNGKKRIIFLGHSNNDIDHFLPVIMGLKAEDMFDASMIFLRFEEEAMTNDLHRELFRIHSLEKRSISDLDEWAFLPRTLFAALKTSFCRMGKDTVTRLFLKGRLREAFYKASYVFLDRILLRFCENLFPRERIGAVIKGLSPDMVFSDIQAVETRQPFSDLRTYFLSSFLGVCRDRNIPVFMMSHGVVVRYIEDDTNIYNTAGLFEPDILALSNEAERKTTSGLAAGGDGATVLGDIRYDEKWINRLETLAERIYDIKKPVNRKVILYLVGNLRFLGDSSLEREIHRDVISLVNDLPGIELWIKPHPRVKTAFSGIISEMTEDARDRVKVFDNRTDTNALMPKADIYITTLSAVIFQAVIKARPVIFYGKWRRYVRKDVPTVFDMSRYVMDARDREELLSSTREALDGKRPTREEASCFYKRAVSAGKDIGGSIVEAYVGKVKEVLSRKNRVYPGVPGQETYEKRYR